MHVMWDTTCSRKLLHIEGTVSLRPVFYSECNIEFWTLYRTFWKVQIRIACEWLLSDQPRMSLARAQGRDQNIDCRRHHDSRNSSTFLIGIRFPQMQPWVAGAKSQAANQRSCQKGRSKSDKRPINDLADRKWSWTCWLRNKTSSELIEWTAKKPNRN